ncbi:hypothetical protein N0V91_005275 [Didymella pomorum]|uniref:Protein kinase domain-containing protein n=1 Tax=Didymella pomorum TaxID=749634 RepID=A0A9W8ZEB1_9PLEO|nr:hypothetical protein N0V91_005275 [Didymella pomorum]
MKLRNFYDYQWKLLAPFFSKGSGSSDVKHYLLREEHILPFVECAEVPGEEGDKAGGYGKVSMVQIHPDHHNFEDPELCSRGFAIKQQIYESDTAIFQTEINVLKKLGGGRGHPHIVSLLATFEQFKKLNLIFHRAQGDLFAYWSDSTDPFVCNYENIKWLAEQCSGLAEGLLRLHKHLTFTKYQIDKLEPAPRAASAPILQQQLASDNGKHVTFNSRRGSLNAGAPVFLQAAFEPAKEQIEKQNFSNFPDGKYVKQYGRHGDINPGNILWYDNGNGTPGALRGTLKIADFGQAELNSLKSRTRQRSVANTLTYRPPESDRGLDRTRPVIRQTYDIWCLACVYLEFLTWFLGGDQLLQRFVKIRLAPDFFQNNMSTDTFFQVTRDARGDTYQVVIKDKVTQVSTPSMPRNDLANQEI